MPITKFLTDRLAGGARICTHINYTPKFRRVDTSPWLYAFRDKSGYHQGH